LFPEFFILYGFVVYTAVERSSLFPNLKKKIKDVTLYCLEIEELKYPSITKSVDLCTGGHLNSISTQSGLAGSLDILRVSQNTIFYPGFAP
jgi:hypothetical protein